MTDLVKRATVGADALSADEYRTGLARGRAAAAAGCSPGACASSAWTAGARPSIARRAPAGRSGRSVAHPPTSCPTRAASTPTRRSPGWLLTCVRRSPVEAPRGRASVRSRAAQGHQPPRRRRPTSRVAGWGAHRLRRRPGRRAREHLPQPGVAGRGRRVDAARAVQQRRAQRRQPDLVPGRTPSGLHVTAGGQEEHAARASRRRGRRDGHPGVPARGHRRPDVVARRAVARLRGEGPDRAATRATTSAASRRAASPTSSAASTARGGWSTGRSTSGWSPPTGRASHATSPPDRTSSPTRRGHPTARGSSSTAPPTTPGTSTSATTCSPSDSTVKPRWT